MLSSELYLCNKELREIYTPTLGDVTFVEGCGTTFYKRLSELAHLRWDKDLQTRNTILVWINPLN